MKHHSPKRAPKRLKTKKKSYKRILTLVSTIFLFTLLTLLAVGYFYLENRQIVIDIAKEDIVQVKQKPITFEEKTKALEIEYIDNVDNSIYVEKQIQNKENINDFHYEEPDYGKIGDIEHEIPKEIILEDNKPKIIITPKVEEKTIIEKEKKTYKPKLAIIIDDVTTKSQVRKIKNIGYTVNMAFLPPTKGHRNSAKIANDLEYYMIHLPLQASSSKYEEDETLYITDDIETIDKKIVELKKLYPKAKFINNHTGSKFTSNKKAMDNLFVVLRKYDYTFVDSRTTAKSVASNVAKKYGVRMLSRNIFLDNNKNKKYIRNQLKKAVTSAKKYGSAIAIGHPFNITFNTLKESKDILADIELVYIHKL